MNTLCRNVVALLLLTTWATVSRAQSKITKCGTLGTNNATYVLQNDVSAPGTCFGIQGSFVKLNLNGHTVTYNAADQTYARYAIVGINCWDPDLTNGKANGNPCGGHFDNLSVFGGTLTEGSGA